MKNKKFGITELKFGITGNKQMRKDMQEVSMLLVKVFLFKQTITEMFAMMNS